MATTTTIQGATLAGYLGVKTDPAPNSDYSLKPPPEAGTAPLLITIAPESCGVTGTVFTFYCNGARFVSGAVIVFDGADSSTAFVGVNTLSMALTPAVLTPGTKTVAVRNPDGAVSETFYFEVHA